MQTEPNPQRPRRSPDTCLSTLLQCRVLPADAERIDKLAREAGVSRSVQLRRLIAGGLEQEGK